MTVKERCAPGEHSYRWETPEDPEYHLDPDYVYQVCERCGEIGYSREKQP